MQGNFEVSRTKDSIKRVDGTEHRNTWCSEFVTRRTDLGECVLDAAVVNCVGVGHPCVL